MAKSEMFAAEEEFRGEGNVQYLMDRPDTPPEVAAMYQDSARGAFETAAANTEQPEGWQS